MCRDRSESVLGVDAVRARLGHRCTRDPGRHDDTIYERGADGAWSTETVFVGPQGPRGLAAGRFHADPGLESLALCGYSREVVLLTRRKSGWEFEVLFVDRDKGHWLSVAELDGRNGTDEILLSGYGGRVLLLSRPRGD